MFKIPEKVKVAGMEYTVNIVPVVIVNDNTNYAGSVDYNELKIELSEKIADNRREETFVHELVHAIFHEAGVEQDEKMVDKVSKILYQVLKDNDFKGEQGLNIDVHCDSGTDTKKIREVIDRVNQIRSMGTSL